MSYVLIFDSTIDKDLGANQGLLSQIERQGSPPTSEERTLLDLRYHLQAEDKVWIFNNFLLLKQAKRSRVLMRS